MSATQLIWLRNDLRLTDHPCIAEAQQQGQIALVICLTPEQWQEHNESVAKSGLRIDLIKALQKQAHSQNIPCHILHLKRFSDCPDAIASLCKQYSYEQVWWQNELPIHESQRDQAVADSLASANIDCQRLAPDLIVSRPVYTQQGDPFKVFTPFYKRWFKLLESHLEAPFEEPELQPSQPLPKQTDMDSLEYRADLWPADFQKIREKLWHFCHKKEAHYDADRDFPAKPGTSLLSPYLTLGALGPRECLQAIIQTNNQNDRNWQSSVWLKELAWRDFYRQLLGHFPDVSKELPFKPETQNVVWRNDEDAFEAWCKGQTGFPIVDAAMRQLNQTGWMHNRLRMIAASFLTKLLLTDWRWGEAYFMQHLIDGEFAANNGGWQWSASTGCDAAPYFRVFNPTRQSERFDENGDFIRKFVPELKDVSSKQIHNPPAELRRKCGYTAPIIDYSSARKDAIAAFENLK